ncbi:Inclusion body clearance protein Iml2/Tetratricopeptide repeat protein 39 [Trypanosoma melophagium]|uniref:Inclusion body clearance protein Iml2/Tetratricopeptide repeat protein 39 n=1 Tax=Trypanosoma melophagium TaxID=715481 RepID=UPI00351A6CE9|nr:Inclusion body clearance protein Iml2/Tetratricopeptide repeat protein 39 [Trypanosoma melophagium]
MEEKDFVQPTEKDFANDNEEIHRLTGRHHALSSDELRQLREASVEDIVKIDKEVARGMDLFFANQVRDSEELFAKNATIDPLYSAGAACITAIKAMLSMDQSDGDIAIERVSFAITFAEELVPAGKSLFQKMGGLFRSDSTKKRLLPGEFRAKTILAASYALRGFVLVIQRTSFNNIIKGGISLNKSYHLFKTLQTELDEVKVEKNVDSFDELGLDSNSVHLVLLGHGCTNVALSILPPRIEHLLNFLGYTHDVEVGTKLVLQCWKSETLFSPFAGLFLMAINSFLPGFCPILVPQTLPLAKDLAGDVLARRTIRNSLIHLWLLGRVRRLERNMTESIDALSKCLEITESGQVVESMPQLRDFAVYDQAWNFVAVGRWKECISYYALFGKKLNMVEDLLYLCPRMLL